MSAVSLVSLHNIKTTDTNSTLRNYLLDIHTNILYLNENRTRNTQRNSQFVSHWLTELSIIIYAV